MPATGQKCETTGKYRAQCIDRTEQQYLEGEIFQKCPKCTEDVEWVLLPSTRMVPRVL